MPSRNVFLLGALGAALIGFLAAVLVSRHDGGGTQRVANFNLVDQRHRPATREIFEGRWSVLYLGFAHCPDVCPTTLALLKTVDARMRARGERIQIVFLSADPERDTPQALARYLSAFDPGFIGLTGRKSEIDELCTSLGLGYVKNPGVNGEYSVDHSAALVLLDPQARPARYFRPPFDAERLVTALEKSVRSQR